MTLVTSILQGGVNSHTTSSEEVNALSTDFVSEGVVGTIGNTSGVAPMTGAYAVNAQGTPNMTVAVSAGVGYVTATPTSGNSQTLRVKNSASANVTIASNSTGGTRYDWLYIKIDPDKAKDPAVDASDVATLVVSRSTSASVDNGTPPTYGTELAVITVANGASSITNSNITDKRINRLISIGNINGGSTAGVLMSDGSGNVTSHAEQSWITPTFQNSWVNYGSGFDDCKYMKDSLGFVHLKGMAKSGTSGAAIFTLPVGYRPAATLYFACPNGGGTAFMGIVSIDSSGIIKNDSGTNTYQSLNGITFKAEA